MNGSRFAAGFGCLVREPCVDLPLIGQHMGDEPSGKSLETQHLLPEKRQEALNQITMVTARPEATA